MGNILSKLVDVTVITYNYDGWTTLTQGRGTGYGRNLTEAAPTQIGQRR